MFFTYVHITGMVNFCRLSVLDFKTIASQTLAFIITRIIQIYSIAYDIAPLRHLLQFYVSTICYGQSLNNSVTSKLEQTFSMILLSF